MTRRWLHALLAAFALAMAAAAAAQAIDPLPFRDHAQEVRFQHLTSQLRCMVCQNETLADSNAGLARDMRHKVFQLMQQGKTDAQIKQYLVDRYSDFVLYDPPVQPDTWLLWFGPFLILAAGGIAVALVVRRRSRARTDMAATQPGTADADDNGDDW